MFQADSHTNTRIFIDQSRLHPNLIQSIINTLTIPGGIAVCGSTRRLAGPEDESLRERQEAGLVTESSAVLL